VKAPEHLAGQSIQLESQVLAASNATFVGRIGHTEVVYKPIAGEQPLWDFPDGNLAHREVAAYLVSQALEWNIVPTTWLGDGPMGTGMMQLWQDVDDSATPVDVVPAGRVPSVGWCQVFDGYDANNQRVSLIHHDSGALRKIAVFDVITNNADRKGGHILPMGDGHLFGIDHGLTFNVEHRLRTVLWGWIGQPLNDEELAGIDRVRAALDGQLGAALADLLTSEEIQIFGDRIEALRSDGTFPAPSGDMPPIPWPPF
jgi:uncharacterized repeat protein (TIGR03843 family)